MPRRTQPMSRRTQFIHSPDLGSFASWPENIASTNKGVPKPRLRVKKMTNPISGSPNVATQVKSPSTKGPMQGAATTPKVMSHEKRAKKSRVGFGGRLGQPKGKSEFPKSEKAHSKGCQHGCYGNQHHGL